MKQVIKRGYQLLFIGICSTLLHACAPKIVSWTNPGFDQHRFKKIVVMGMFKSLEVRLAFEEEVVDALLANGYTAGHGMTVIPPTYEVTSDEQMARIFKTNGFDAVIMASKIDEKSEVQYHSNYSTAYARPYGYGYGMYNYYNYRYGYDVYYGGYGSGWADQGYYTQQTEYLIECKLFQIGENVSSDQALVWTGQTRLTESSSVRSVARNYAKKLISSLEKSDVLNQ